MKFLFCTLALSFLAACTGQPTSPETQAYFDAKDRVPSAPTDNLPWHVQAELRPQHK